VKEPPPVSDPNSNASTLVRALVSAGQSDLPAPDRLDGVWARLGPLSAAPAFSGDGGGAASGGAAAAGATAKSAAALKLAAGLLVGVALAGGAVVEVRRARAPDGSQGLHAARAAIGASPPLAVASAPAASAEDVAVPVTSLPFAAPPTLRPSVALASPAASANVVPQAPPAQQEAPAESEIALLQAAKVALRDDPAAALALADRHARRFAAGALAQEREVIAVEALVALGRADDARDRGARFERDFPQSAHRLRIESLLRAGDHNR
jgi:hypothetical protein